MLRQESQPWSFVLFIGHVQGLFIIWMWLLVSSPKYFCSNCVYFDICPSTTQSVCFDTYSIVIVLTSGHVAGWINTSVSCLVKLPLLFLAMGTLTLVSLVLWVSTQIPTSLQLSWLVDKHGVFLWMKVYSAHCTQNIVNINKTQYKQANLSTILQVGLLSLCFGWPIPKGWWDQWPMGFTKFCFMVIYISISNTIIGKAEAHLDLNVSIEIRMSLLRALITSVFLYGCET